jgi:tight adherence protein C
MQIVIITFAAVFLLVLSLALLVQQRNRARMQLTMIGSAEAEPSGLFSKLFQQNAVRSAERFISPLQKLVPRSELETSVVKKRLRLAGFRKPFHVDCFYASKVLCPLAGVLIVTVTGTYDVGPLFAYGLAIGLGFLIPDFWVGEKIRARKLNIQLGLAEALDLMVVCIEAGLGLDQTAQRVAQELQRSQPELSEEFHLLHLEQRAGQSRSEAWRNLADRVDLESVRTLVTTLVQADQFGTSVSTGLRMHSETLRTQRRQKAEEEAAKTTVKLVFPLVFFIFPSLFLVVLGPSMIILIEAFKQYLLN